MNLSPTVYLTARVVGGRWRGRAEGSLYCTIPETPRGQIPWAQWLLRGWALKPGKEQDPWGQAVELNEGTLVCFSQPHVGAPRSRKHMPREFHRCPETRGQRKASLPGIAQVVSSAHRKRQAHPEHCQGNCCTEAPKGEGRREREKARGGFS